MGTTSNKHGYTFQKNSKGFLVTGDLKGEKHSGEISNDISEEEIKNFNENDFAKIRPSKMKH